MEAADLIDETREKREGSDVQFYTVTLHMANSPVIEVGQPCLVRIDKLRLN